MRVLVLTDIYNRPETETFIGLKKAGVDLEMLVRPEPAYPRVQEAGIPTTDFAVNGRFDLKAIKALRKKLKEGRYDILHAFNNKAVSVGVIASVGLPVRIVAYRGIVGNVSFLSPNSWMTYLNPKVKKVICVCEAIRTFFLKMNFLGHKLDPKKFVTIYKGHKLEWYQAPQTDLTQFGVPGNAFVIGLAGRDRPRKGIEVLIEAINRLPENVDVHLLLVGKMHRKKLMRKIAASPRKNNIHLAGYRKDAPQIAAACNIFCLPSLEREGLPRAVIEAMAYGTPAIVSDTGGNPELVQNGVSGFSVRAGSADQLSEAIYKIFRDPELCKSMGIAAKERIDRHFNNQTTVDETLALYKEVMAE